MQEREERGESAEPYRFFWGFAKRAEIDPPSGKVLSMG